VALKPENTDSIRTEEKAILHYWKAQKDSWVSQGKRQAAENFNRPGNQKRARTESHELEQANVSQSHDHTYHKLTPLPDILPTPHQKSQERFNSRQFPLPKQRPCHQKWEIPQEESSKETDHRVNRRRSKHHIHHSRELHSQILDFTLECEEFKLDKYNLKTIGVAKTLTHNISNTFIPQEEL